MNRCIVFLLPLLFMFSSCGTTAQYAQQRYQDGVYGSRKVAATEAIHIYSKEEFVAMAAANIAREQEELGGDIDTVYVILDLAQDDWYNYPWYYGRPYYWSYSSWYYPWYSSWYWYYDPWYYSWYWDPWFRHHRHHHHRHHHHHHHAHHRFAHNSFAWHGAGASYRANRVHTPRYMTQGGVSSLFRTSSASRTRTYGSSGASYTRSSTRASSSGTVNSSGANTYSRSSSVSRSSSNSGNSSTYSRSSSSGQSRSSTYSRSSSGGSGRSGTTTRSGGGGSSSSRSRR